MTVFGTWRSSTAALRCLRFLVTSRPKTSGECIGTVTVVLYRRLLFITLIAASYAHLYLLARVMIKYAWLFVSHHTPLSNGSFSWGPKQVPWYALALGGAFLRGLPERRRCALEDPFVRPHTNLPLHRIPRDPGGYRRLTSFCTVLSR